MIGGDDLAARTAEKPTFDPKASEKLGTLLRLEAQRQFFFNFHSMLHCAAGSFPDVYNVVLIK